MRGYDAIKALKKRHTYRKVTDLLVMANQNDPFYAGSEGQRAKAEWFADLWRQFGYSSGVHLRRVHYQLVSQRNPRKHDGMGYENTEGCWDYLQEAGRMARYLELVDAEAFEDHRNPDPQIYAANAVYRAEPGFDVSSLWWYLPVIKTDLDESVSLNLPSPHVTGYDYRPADQPYHIELWVEKSTMDDVLLPLAQRLNINLVTSLGFQSITSVVNMLKRIKAGGKPARIFYISDFDPAGDRMPVQVARQVEFWLSEYAPDCDIKLTPLALTLDQVQTHQLPRIPVKDTDRRKAGFEERYGEGQVELDALEALYPGTLAQIVRQAVIPYRDARLSARLEETRSEAEAEVEEAWQEATGDIETELEVIGDEARAILARYQSRLTELAAELDTDLAPLRERLEIARQAVQKAADELEVDLPERPEAEVYPPSEDGWLFDAGREYMDQLAVYKARQARDDQAAA